MVRVRDDSISVADAEQLIAGELKRAQDLGAPGPPAGTYPELAVELRSTEMSYAEAAELSARITTQAWTTDVATRITSLRHDYASGVLVGVEQLTKEDADNAKEAFGDLVKLVDEHRSEQSG